MIRYNLKKGINGQRFFSIENDLSRIPVSEFLEYEKAVIYPTDGSDIELAEYIYNSVGFFGKWEDGSRIGDYAKQLSIGEVTAIWKTFEAGLKIPESNSSYFDLNGERYFYPSENLQESGFGDFVNAEQLRHFYSTQKERKHEESLFIMALLCRKKNESAFKRQEDLNARFELFKKVSMQELLTFAFFLQKRNGQSLTNSVRLLRELLIQNGLPLAVTR